MEFSLHTHVSSFCVKHIHKRNIKRDLLTKNLKDTFIFCYYPLLKVKSSRYIYTTVPIQEKGQRGFLMLLSTICFYLIAFYLVSGKNKKIIVLILFLLFFLLFLTCTSFPFSFVECCPFINLLIGLF